MGDPRRGELFAAFIHRQFPTAQRVLCVADGNFVTARPLIRYVTRVDVFDPWMRAKNSSRGIVGHKQCFTAQTRGIRTHVVIGMHPDAATGEALLYALTHHLPFALCPCCIKGILSEGITSKRGWFTRLRGTAERAHYHTWTTLLPMTGDNVVLVGTPKRRGR